MKTIPSFTIDHERLLRGIYVSRKDQVGKEIVTTFDIRMKEPNREPVLGQAEMHTIEHLGATYLRDHSAWGGRVIYWGPMGCCTGFYFIVRGDFLPNDIAAVIQATFLFIRGFEGEIPGVAPKECGNYLLHNLPMARYEAKKFFTEVLERLKEKNTVYPQ